MNRYSNYTAIDFAKDRYFQDWVLDGVDDEFWKKFCEESPTAKQEIAEARILLRSIGFSVQLPREEVVQKRLDEALRSIATKETGRLVSFRSMKWVAAAIVFMLGGYWIFTQYVVSPSADYVSSQQMKEAGKSAGQVATLTLADGTKVSLDSVNNGAVAKQGSMVIVKSGNGKLIYKGGETASGEAFYNTITIPAGSTYELTLADGTKVWLNALSKLRFPTAFVQEHRHVELTGESYFEVAPDKSRPFIVKTLNDTEIKVLGTSFNVKAYGGDEITETTLIEGVVRVESKGRDALLKPGQQARSVADRINVANDVNLQNITAWKRGFFQFNNVKIDMILKEAARWYDADIIYEGNVSDLFSGTVPRDVSLKNFLQVLEATNKVEFDVVGKQVFVKPR